ncbi:histidinol-phosphate transaminase [Shewanella sp. GXUN23E]|uniref:histidinol-phosphate transaminase n=1 Tax=Shewanella sp. GXUN23E TaxID=3422498 RepID=UPI003D7DB77F
MSTITQQATDLARRLARAELLDLEPYQSARRIGGRGDIWINANESPFNNTYLALANRYPECQPPALMQAYADYVGVTPQQLVCGRGADEAIELLIRTFCVPGQDAIVTFGPTYGMYGISAATFNVGVTELALDDDWQLPPAAAIDDTIQAQKLIFVCNPNNPTGSIIPLARIRQLLEQFPDKLVIVDEAYIEFCPEQSCVPLLEEFANLVVLRTLSKAFALAGIRCGFMLAHPGIVELVMRVIAPYPVPVPVSALATQALNREGIATMRTQVQSLNANGEQLAQAIIKAGGIAQRSAANFVLAKFADIKTVESVAERLAASGIVARRYKHPRLQDAIRLSYTNDAETNVIIAALQAFTGQISSSTCVSNG